MHSSLFPIILETLSHIIIKKTDSNIIVKYIEFLMKLKLYSTALDLIKEYIRDSRYLNSYELYYYQGLILLFTLIEDVESLLNKKINFNFSSLYSNSNNNLNLNNINNFYYTQSFNL